MDKHDVIIVLLCVAIAISLGSAWYKSDCATHDSLKAAIAPAARIAQCNQECFDNFPPLPPTASKEKKDIWENALNNCLDVCEITDYTASCQAQKDACYADPAMKKMDPLEVDKFCKNLMSECLQAEAQDKAQADSSEIDTSANNPAFAARRRRRR